MKQKPSAILRTTYMAIIMTDDRKTNVPSINVRLFQHKDDFASFCQRNQYIAIFKLKHTSKVMDNFFSSKLVKNLSSQFNNLVDNIYDTLGKLDLPILSIGNDYFHNFYTGKYRRLLSISDFMHSYYHRPYYSNRSALTCNISIL